MLLPPDPGYDPRTVTVTVRVPVSVLGLGEYMVEAAAVAEFDPVALLASHPGPRQVTHPDAAR